ncbi:sulfate transporter family-domain-containing protein [Zychaea mexicana]|uniref:sulfate transporter family-domain-containing protein n=1 Tax=Zychaea mexicana TaxID=64656 RepID=UPI0022FEAC91|nr:sulfate transporter family-domain-containing protein [Zychaea mexicana]KAI9493598.1 sulfate transporter family-domain-containing protein [Zychaea mexicana]
MTTTDTSTTSSSSNTPLILDYEPISYPKIAARFARKLPRYTKEYLCSFFPIVYWIHRYNLTWLISDVIAGVTVGIVVVPQGMGYAKIANLPPEYGLYSSFVGLAIYCFFGTSKDISIGPTAVMSLLVGQTVSNVATAESGYTGPQIGVAMALFGGIISVALGMLRLGILVDFIPEPAIAGFMTGSAITIAIGQYPKLFGMTGVDTHDATYLVFGNFFKHLPDTHLDVAFGLVGLFVLYGFRMGTTYLGKKYPRHEKLWFFINIMRNGVVVIFGTLFAWAIQLHKDESPISILEDVPAGFTAMGVPTFDTNLLSEIAGTLPSVVIILILEHVAIAKSFGRRNNYKINADQEIIALGVANIIGCFFGAYPNTGSFSRTAIKARSGVRTPLAGVFSALVVLLCLYALTPAFYYIPDAILAAVIIHAVSDLVSGPKFVQHLWHINPLELFTFVAAVIITFFTSVEYGIYVSVALAVFFMLIRIARPRYAVLGRVPVRPIRPDIQDEKKSDAKPNDSDVEYVYVKESHPTLHDIVEPPPPGVLIFRLDESLTYPNAGFISDKIMHYVQDNFTSGLAPPTTRGERAWNDRRPLVKKEDLEAVMAAREASGRKLRAIVLDFSAVNHLDSTGVQALLDLRLAINRYVGREVEWHFASLATPFIRNALMIAGFGSQNGRDSHPLELVPIVPPQLQQQQQQQQQEGAAAAANDNVKSGSDSAATATASSTSDHCAIDTEVIDMDTIDISEKRSVYYSIHQLPSSSSSSSSIHSTATAHSSSNKVAGDDDRASARSVRTTRTSSPSVINIDRHGNLSYYPLLERGLPIDRAPFFHWDLEDAVRAATFAASRD